MIPYIFHVSLLITLSYGLYRFLWEKETFFDLHRWILLLGLLLAFALPLLVIPSNWSVLAELHTPIPASEQAADMPASNTKEQDFIPTNNKKASANKEEAKERKHTTVAFTPSSKSPQKNTSFFEFVANLPFATYATYIYLTGVVLFGINFLIQLLLIFFQRATNPIVKDGRFKIVEINQDKAPFSFGQSIFINPTKYDWATYSQILAHEKIHVQQGHSLDIVLTELMVMIQWFNPFAWAYRKIIENNLEYQTDQLMLQQGTEKEAYQMNLLRISVPHLPLNLTTNYNQSFLKKRILMMNCKKSSASSSWKYLLLLPLLGLSVITLNPIALQSHPTKAIAKLGINESQPLTTTLLAEPSEVETSVPTPIQELARNKKTKKDKTKKLKIKTKTKPKVALKDKQQLVTIEKDANKAGIHIQGAASFEEDNIIVHKGAILVDGVVLTLDHTGSWTADLKGNQICIQFMHRSKRDGYNMHRDQCFDYKEITPNPTTNAKGPFLISREAGTLELRGVFENQEGFGKYSFAQNEDFLTYLADQGIRLKEKNLAFHLFMSDFNKQYLSYLKQEGYTNLSKKDIKTIAYHGLTQEEVQGYLRGLNRMNFKKPSLKELNELAIHNVSIDYIEKMGREVFEDLTIKQVVQASIHQVAPAFINELASLGYDDLSFKEILTFSIHNVDVDFIKAVRAQGLDLDKEEIVQAAIHNVDADYIQEVRALGYKDLSFRNIVEFSIHGIDTKYIQELKETGLDLDQKEVVQAAIHNVDANFIKEVRNLGYDDLSFDDIIAFGIHGVDAAYMKDLKMAGLTNLSKNQIVEAAIHGISPSYIKKVHAMGFGQLDFKDIIAFKIHGVSPTFIQSLKDAGLKDLTQRQIVNAAIHGVTASFIKRVKESGAFENDLTIKDYIDLKIHGIERKLKKGEK